MVVPSRLFDWTVWHIFLIHTLTLYLHILFLLWFVFLLSYISTIWNISLIVLWYWWYELIWTYCVHLTILTHTKTNPTDLKYYIVVNIIAHLSSVSSLDWRITLGHYTSDEMNWFDYVYIVCLLRPLPPLNWIINRH